MHTPITPSDAQHVPLLPSLHPCVCMQVPLGTTGEQVIDRAMSRRSTPGTPTPPRGSLLTQMHTPITLSDAQRTPLLPAPLQVPLGTTGEQVINRAMSRRSTPGNAIISGNSLDTHERTDFPF